METYLQPVSVEELTETDLDWLAKGCALQPEPVEVSAVLTKAANGGVGLFRIRTGGMMVIYISTTLGGFRELFVWLLIGQRVLKHIKAFSAELDLLAKANDCFCISGLVSRDGLAKVYADELGAKPVATIFRKEV